jgi:hypothetical protein
VPNGTGVARATLSESDGDAGSAIEAIADQVSRTAMTPEACGGSTYAVKECAEAGSWSGD